MSRRPVRSELHRPGQGPKVQAIAEHGLVSIHCINALATRYTCVLVYRANPADGHGIVTLHDRCVTIPCPAFLAGVELNANEAMYSDGVDLSPLVPNCVARL